MNENGVILIFWLDVKKTLKNVQKGMFFGYSVRSPHRTAKPSRGCLRVVGLKPHADFPPCKRRGTKVINKKPKLPPETRCFAHTLMMMN